jgi:hypothetical protein
MVFDLLPHMHQEVNVRAAKHTKLATMDTFEAFSKASAAAADGGPPIKYSDYFETFEDMNITVTLSLAAHITGWSGITKDGVEVPYSFNASVELLQEYQPFAEWIEEQVVLLAGPVVEAADKAEDIKKKSDDTSAS